MYGDQRPEKPEWPKGVPWGVVAMPRVPVHQAIFFESSRLVVGRGGWRGGAFGGCYIASSVAGVDDESEGGNGDPDSRDVANRGRQTRDHF